MTKDESTLRKEQAEKTKQKLLAAAKSLFSKNGYNGTSVPRKATAMNNTAASPLKKCLYRDLTVLPI